MPSSMVPPHSLMMMGAVRGREEAGIECQVCHELCYDFRTVIIGWADQPYDTYVELTGHESCVNKKRNKMLKDKSFGK